MAMTTLDAPHVLKSSFDEPNEALRVNVVASVVAAAQIDDAPFAPAAGVVGVNGAVFDDVAPDAVDEGDAGAIRMSANRSLYVNLRDGLGNERGVAITVANAVKTDGSATTQPISAVALPLPAGSATSALQTTSNTKLDTGNTSLASIDGKIVAVNTGAVVVSSSALPAGSATSAKQDTAQTSLTSIDGKLVAVNTGAVVVSSSALPAGAATSAKQDTEIASLAAIDGKIVAVNTGAVVIASGTVNATQSGYTLAEFVRNDYTSVSVTTGAYVEVIASTANIYQEVHIADTSGQTLKLAVGGVGAEVDKLIIPPGGPYPLKFRIAAGSRISIKALSATASVGEIDIQLLG